MSNVRKLLVSMDRRDKKLSQNQTNDYISSDHLVNDEEITPIDISKQFDKDRRLKNREVQKKILLSTISSQIGAIVKNKLKEYQFKCYEKPKNNFMHTFKQQTKIIDQINKRKLISRS